MSEDNVLYEKYLNGNIESLEKLVEKYSDRLIYFINCYVNNLEESEDIMMEVFLSVLMHKKRFKNKSSFKTYMFSIAKHKSIDFIRKHNSQKNIINNETSYSVENEILNNDLKQKVYSVLFELPKDYMDILYYTYIEDMTIEEIVKILNKTHKQIYNLNVRAKIKLKEILIKKGVNYEIN